MLTIKTAGNIYGRSTWGVIRSLLRARPIKSVRCAISYVMQSGSSIIRNDLSDLLATGTDVTIVFGDDFRLSESAALRSLMDLGCRLRLYASESHPGFHPKMWLIDYSDDTRAAIVGSSNLSRGGLISNAEANVILEGPNHNLAEFDVFWHAVVSASHRFTDTDLENYADSERTAAVPPKTATATSSVDATAQLVREHIARWQRFIQHPDRIGQSARWRGWYLVPEQGQLTLAKLLELSRVLNAILTQPEYTQEGAIEFGTDNAGISNAVAVLDQAGITTQRTFTDLQRRGLFVRQQRLYLQTFEFIREITRQRFEVTTLGLDFARAQSDEERQQLFTVAMSRKQWLFGPLAFYPFLRQVIDRVPERRLYYDEMSLIVIHSYHQAEMQGIVNLVTAYRGLPGNVRYSVSEDADHHLRQLLGQYAGGSAYDRYRRKVADLMVAFGTTVGFLFIAAEPEERSYIELTVPLRDLEPVVSSES